MLRDGVLVSTAAASFCPQWKSYRFRLFTRLFAKSRFSKSGTTGASRVFDVSNGSHAAETLMAAMRGQFSPRWLRKLVKINLY